MNGEEQNPPLTFGQEAVGLKFNPSNDDLVGQIKQKYADIIDLIQGHNNEGKDGHLMAHIKGEAVRSAMSAQMWAVKHVTFSK